MKLAPRIFGRMDKIWGKLYFSLQMLRMTTGKNTKIVEILRENEKRRGRVNNENNLKSILERHLTDEIHSYVNFEKNLRITPGKLEESGKIRGKDLWVRAH